MCPKISNIITFTLLLLLPTVGSNGQPGPPTEAYRCAHRLSIQQSEMLNMYYIHTGKPFTYIKF